MRRISLLLVLVFLIGFLSGCGNDQYALERKIWYVQRQADNILKNPLATPPRELDRVIVLIKELIDDNPNTILALQQDFLIGRLYMAKEKFAEARDQFNSILEKYGQNKDVASEAVFFIGYTYELEDNWQSALEQYKKIMNEYPATGKGLDAPIYIAKYYQAKYQPEKMVDAYKEAIVYYDSLGLRYPDKRLGFSASNLKAQCYIELKDWESALGAFNAILEKYQGSEELDQVMMRKALVYSQGLSDITKAKEVLQDLIKTYPESRFLVAATEMLKELSENK
jgi:TolA-binding protein